jgi:hypothetical protein
MKDLLMLDQQMIKSLPKMIEIHHDLVAGLKGHLEGTNKEVERLDKVFEKLYKQPSGNRPSTASSRPTRRPATSKTRPCWPPPSSRAHRLGRRNSVTTNRALPHDQPERGESREHQAQHVDAAEVNAKASNAA